jgi:anti-sigma factor ChrR (cupin superfamily)
VGDENINGNLSVRTTVRTADMEWSPSPSPSVWRKRMHRVGPPESGQVTSIVRYDSDSSFPVHNHPEGEEIFVLEGIFTDDRGDWPAGTYLLNPEGYRHAPSSREGCVLFVKLRQFPGLDRQQVAIDTTTLDWLPGEEGTEVKRLYAQDGFSDSTVIERWAAGYAPASRAYPEGAELFVLEGEFSDEAGSYPTGTWTRMPVGSSHSPETAGGCTVYMKRGGFAYLRQQ